MKYLSEYRTADLARPLIEELQSFPPRKLRFMEVCGTHTMAIFQHGIRSLLPEGMELISGPGCPVCVTSASHIDLFIELALQKQVRVAIFGDLLRVPGSKGSLSQASAQGANVEVVYSALDSLSLAQQHPDEQIIFLSVGFETTTPTVAATILEAKRQQLDNFSVLSTQKVVIPPLQQLLSDKSLAIQGLLCPGHVSTIIGAAAYQGIAKDFKLPCVVAGFEPADVLLALIMLRRQCEQGCFAVENGYQRAVSWQGNERAQAMVDQVFQPADTLWRGLGLLANSGLRIRDGYSHFDADKRFGLPLPESKEPAGCLCGKILCGQQIPTDCPLFGRACTPQNPVGPCMVSSEGTCAAYFRYADL